MGAASGRPARPALYLDAVRNARLEQLLARPRRLLPARLLAAGIAVPDVVPWRPLARGLGADPAPSCGAVTGPEATGSFEAFGHVRHVDSPRFWSEPGDGLLFLFHLHGFVALATYAAGPRTAAGDRFWAGVVESWLATQSRPQRPAWHPYPTSLRLIAWSAALSTLEHWPEALRARIARELWRQSTYLRRSIERDIGGNHVLKNATALSFVGAVVPRSGALEAGLRLLQGELGRQLLVDGGHEERSTSYHRAVVRDLSEVGELVRRAGRAEPAWLRSSIDRAAAWQAALTGPDSKLPLLNDAWAGPSLPDRATGEITVLRASGYVVLRHRRDQLVFDCGPLCPPHLPPHAHADALSFVLWVDGSPLIVDPGAFAYSGSERHAFRATAAHNTVEVDGEDQCVFWGDFRASLLPRIQGPTVERVGELIVVRGSHDGYRRLSHPATHRRTVVWWPAMGVVIVDSITGEASHLVRSRLCLAPGVATDGTQAGPFSVRPLATGDVVGVEDRDYAPLLGQKVVTRGLLQQRTVEPGAGFGWSLLRPGASARLDSPDTLSLEHESDGSAAVKVNVV